MDDEKIGFEEEAVFNYEDYSWIWEENTFSHERFQHVTNVEVFVKIWDIVVFKEG